MTCLSSLGQGRHYSRAERLLRGHKAGDPGHNKSCHFPPQKPLHCLGWGRQHTQGRVLRQTSWGRQAKQDDWPEGSPRPGLSPHQRFQLPKHGSRDSLAEFACASFCTYCFSNKRCNILFTFRILISTFLSRQARTGDLGSSHWPLWAAVGLLVYTHVTRVRFLVRELRPHFQLLLLCPKSIRQRSLYPCAREDTPKPQCPSARARNTLYYRPPGAPPRT